nr:COP9 signalosome complex subunit 2 [Tanacetum cinerariifolium]
HAGDNKECKIRASGELNASVEEKDSLTLVWHKTLGHISKPKPRAVKCVLLKYPEGVNGYRLYRLDNESPKIVTSRNVVFNESVMYKDILKDSGASLVEIDPEGAFTAFAKVVQMEARLVNVFIKPYLRYKETTDAYREMLTYIKSGLTRNYSEKFVNNIMDFVSGSASQNIGLFEREFGKIWEILGLSIQDGEEVRKCYINFLDVFTSYYKTASVLNSERNTVLGMPTKIVEKGKEYTCLTFHQCDFGDNQAPNKEAASTKGKEKIEHFGIILEDTRKNGDSHQS